MIPRRCANEWGGGAPHDSPAEGYNPLGLCPSCLRSYRKKAGIDRTVGEGNPSPGYRLRICPMGCHEAERTEHGLTAASFCQKAKVTKNGGQTFVEPSPECVLLARVSEKPKRQAPANDTAAEARQIALGGGR